MAVAVAGASERTTAWESFATSTLSVVGCVGFTFQLCAPPATESYARLHSETSLLQRQPLSVDRTETLPDISLAQRGSRVLLAFMYLAIAALTAIFALSTPPTTELWEGGDCAAASSFPLLVRLYRPRYSTEAKVLSDDSFRASARPLEGASLTRVCIIFRRPFARSTSHSASHLEFTLPYAGRPRTHPTRPPRSCQIPRTR